MARHDSMAAIDAALARASLPTTTPGTTIDSVTPDVTIAPGVSSDAPLTELTADQKRAWDANRQSAIDRKAEQKREASEQEAAFKQQEATEKSERDAFKASAKATTDAVKGVVRGAGVTLGNLPQPGSIVFPLVVLVIFFLLLLPVNGHTRFVWLWMVLSGNAQIGQAIPDSGTGGSGTSGSESNNPGDTSVNLPNAALLSPVTLNSVGLGTYVEEP